MCAQGGCEAAAGCVYANAPMVVSVLFIQMGSVALVSKAAALADNVPVGPVVRSEEV